MSKSKKWIIVGVLVIVFLLVVMGGVRDYNERKLLAESEQYLDTDGSEEEESWEEQEQRSLVEQFGEPPSGFLWDSDGTLKALGTSELTGEEVGYAFLRALSLLDFSTAEKYSSGSFVADNYRQLYSTDYAFNSNTAFQRRMYKEVLVSLRVDSLKDYAVFADGDIILSFEINSIDLSNKDFWREHEKEIFETLYTYYEEESDNIKAYQYLYDYILGVYESEDAPRATRTLDLYLEKHDEGWLVTNDSDIDMIATYTDGQLVVDHIMDEYSDWLYEQGR